jgi:hypothetical protein
LKAVPDQSVSADILGEYRSGFPQCRREIPEPGAGTAGLLHKLTNP